MVEKVDWGRFKVLRAQWQENPSFKNVLKFTYSNYVWIMSALAFELGFNKDESLRILDMATGFGWFPLALECLGHTSLSFDGGEMGMKDGEECIKFKSFPSQYRIKEFESLPVDFQALDFIKMMGCNLRRSDKLAFGQKEYVFFIKDLYSRLNPGGRILFIFNRAPAPQDAHFVNNIFKSAFWKSVARETGISIKFNGKDHVYIGQWGNHYPNLRTVMQRVSKV